MLCFSVSEHVLPLSPKTKQKSNPSRISLFASQRSSGPPSHLVQTKASNTPLKPSAQREDITNLQASPQRFSGKKDDYCSKRKQSPKQQKLEDSSPKKNNTPEDSFDTILELFKPMPPCISPLQDLVRVLPL